MNLCLCSTFSWLKPLSKLAILLSSVQSWFSSSHLLEQQPFDQVKWMKMGRQHPPACKRAILLGSIINLRQSTETLYKCLKFCLTRTPKPKHVFFRPWKAVRIWSLHMWALTDIYGLFFWSYFRRRRLRGNLEWRVYSIRVKSVSFCDVWFKGGWKVPNIPVSSLYKPLVAHLISDTQNLLFIQLDSTVM